MDSKYRRIALATFLASMGALLPACHTTEGAGEDIQELGDSIEDAADDAKDSSE